MTAVKGRYKNDYMWFMFLIATGLIGAELAAYSRADAYFYAIALVSGAVYVAWHSTEVIWVGFFLLALTSQIYPLEVDELRSSVQGTYRPYIVIVLLMAAAILVARWIRAERNSSRTVSDYAGVRGRVAALTAVLILTLIYGYLTSMKAATLLDVLRECSGWLTFLLFLFLGYRRSSIVETQRAFARLRLSVLVYSIFFIIKFVYLSLSSGIDYAADEFGQSQRDVIFFAGLVLVFIVVQALAPEVKSAWKGTWPTALTLLFAVLLCGARSVAACVLLVIFSFIFIWYSKARLRLGFVAVAGILLVFVGPSLNLAPDYNPDQGVFGYVASRFLKTSTEDTSYLSRASEMLAVAEAVRDHPLLGNGPLASYSFFDPIFGWKDTTFLDSGLGYLLMKTGLLGSGVFFWFALGWLKLARGLRRSAHAQILAPLAIFAFYLAYLPFGPSFFEFQHAWLIGLLSGQVICTASAIPAREFRPVPGALRKQGATV